MNTDARCFKIKTINQTFKIHFNFDYMPDPTERKVTWCVIETERHEFYSGVAVRHPKEYSNVKTGWKISLKRACEAMNWVFGESYYKHFWHKIRLQLRKEHDAEMLAITEEILNNDKVREK